MIETVFDSGSLPPADRLAGFDEFQFRSVHPMRVSADDPARFNARARALDLAEVNVVELTSSASDIRRTPRMIREADPGLYSIVLPVRGRVAVAQGEHVADLGVRDMALYTSSHPLHVRLAPGRDTTLLRAHLPRALLPLPGREIDGLAATRLPGRAGVGALLAEFLTRLTTDATMYTPADTARLSAVAVDLLTATLAHHLDTDPSGGARQGELLPRIAAFILRNLDDPELSPATVAAAHHISVSYLHRLFEAHEMTAAAWIRRRRLDRAGRDLADPALRDLPVHRIAARWGFTDHATFTRAFRAVYAVPPREYRLRALGPAGRQGAVERAVSRS